VWVSPDSTRVGRRVSSLRERASDDSVEVVHDGLDEPKGKRPPRSEEVASEDDGNEVEDGVAELDAVVDFASEEVEAMKVCLGASETVEVGIEVTEPEGAADLG